MNNIYRTYLDYNGVDIFKDQVIIQDNTATVMGAMSKYVKLVGLGFNSTSPEMLAYVETVDAWADQTTKLSTTFADLERLGSLLTTKQAGFTTLKLCSQAILEGWQTYSHKSPVDDRQYFGIIYGWVLSLVDLQTQAMQMLQAAHLYKCVFPACFPIVGLPRLS